MPSRGKRDSLNPRERPDLYQVKKIFTFALLSNPSSLSKDKGIKIQGMSNKSLLNTNFWLKKGSTSQKTLTLISEQRSENRQVNSGLWPPFKRGHVCCSGPSWEWCYSLPPWTEWLLWHLPRKELSQTILHLHLRRMSDWVKASPLLQKTPLRQFFHCSHSLLPLRRSDLTDSPWQRENKILFPYSSLYYRYPMALTSLKKSSSAYIL